MAAISDAFGALMAMVGGAGAILAGEPADDGVEVAGDAMLSLIVNLVTWDDTMNFRHRH
jgi:hypothetical protein